MTDQFAALRVFVRLAQTGSFSRTARELKLSQPTTSRMISDLEAHLGVTLFNRTTRAVALTQAGADYLADIQPILDALTEADYRIRGSGELRGELRVSMASIIASRIILPRLKSFMAEHPHLTVLLSTEDRRQDLILEGIDVALRFGTLADSSALARKVGSWPLIMAGAPDYLRQQGTPSSPSDLTAHRFVVAGPVAARTLLIEQNGLEIPVEIHGNLTVTGTDAGVVAGKEGLGLVVATVPALIADIETGSLVRVMADWNLGAVDAYALYPGGQTPKPAARVFVEFMIDALSDVDLCPE
ncbi:LysR family transcriptional regulator [Pseudomonas sp. RC10]|uniref:LysR family transcriptional regulator n=1 Tax=Pseudomonas bambusae TaxID=3139142 RepID=UPI003139A0ED